MRKTSTNRKKSIREVLNFLKEESKGRVLTRSKERQNQLGEVFTPPILVLDMIKKLPKSVWNEGKTFCDPAAGTGNFLVSVLYIKMRKGHQSPLSTIYGVDIMEDNVAECRERLLAIAGDTEENRAIVNRNIVCADALKYDFSFGQEEK